MKKTIAIFSVLILALLLLFQLSKYALISNNLKTEIAIAGIAIVFFFIGIYINKKSLNKQETTSQEINYDKIKTHDHLAFLRTQIEFEQFVRNGYTFQAALAAKAPQPMELTDDVVAKLERLASLKEKGILTEDEFQMQKAKLLRL